MSARTPATRRAFVADPDAIYLTDNGRAVCGEHLGATAAATGRDISGQQVYRLTKADAQWWQQHSEAPGDKRPKCEDCPKRWTR